MPPATSPAPLISFAAITKRFPGVTALSEVSFEVRAGSCHAVCGENGAGKSTLGKILAGIEQPDAGSIRLGGQLVRFHSPGDARASGIAMVHQELAFCDNLSVEENLCLGALPATRAFLSRTRLRQRATAMLHAVGANIDPARQVATLRVAEQQQVQIAAAIGSGARVIIFDEPTSALGEAESEQLFALMTQLKSQGITMLYVTHRMPEIFRLCDTVTVLRDGHHVATQPVTSLDEKSLVQQMVGRDIGEYFPASTRRPLGNELLRIESFTSRGRFRDISFTLRVGEVIGLAGLTGAGRSELAQALFGLDPASSGTIYMDGKAVAVRSPAQALKLGLGLVPEDRKRQGLILSLLSRENLTLPILGRLSRFTFVHTRVEREFAREQLERVQVKADQVETIVATLSGGNQQKVVLARWLATRSRVLILDEPTRGVDVGAKAELHAWIERVAAEGMGVILISSELPELLNLSHRILVLRSGRIVGEVAREEAEQAGLLRMMAGLQNADVRTTELAHKD